MSELQGSAGHLAAGQFVLENQKTGDGFRNVSNRWLQTTISYEEGMEEVQRGRAETEDFTATLRKVRPMVDQGGNFVMRYKDRAFRPTEHALGQMGTWAGVGQWFPLKLMENPTNEKGSQLFARDTGDAETLVRVLNNGFRRIDQDKAFLWRVRKDGTLRAMLSDQYAMLDNGWFIKMLSKIVPSGRLSHWRGDSDTIYGNVLISDSIRAETDSEYGGMLSIGNSEIGQRNLVSLPSIFRAICQNGCIWGQQKGEGIRVIHRGEINLEELYGRIKNNLDKQIPLLPQGIEMLLGTKLYDYNGDSMLPVFARVADVFKLSRAQASSLVSAHRQEPEYANTLFGVINAITRAGQELSNESWLSFDKIGGKMVAYSRNQWDSLVSSANSMSLKDVEAAFAKAA